MARRGIEPRTHGFSDRNHKGVVNVSKGDYKSINQKAKELLADLPDQYQKLPTKELKKILMKAEVILHKQLQSTKRTV
ncbi:MAG: hypothetical protein ACOC2U_01390 [bacterium]